MFCQTVFASIAVATAEPTKLLNMFVKIHFLISADGKRLGMSS